MPKRNLETPKTTYDLAVQLETARLAHEKSIQVQQSARGEYSRLQKMLEEASDRETQAMMRSRLPLGPKLSRFSQLIEGMSESDAISRAAGVAATANMMPPGTIIAQDRHGAITLGRVDKHSLAAEMGLIKVVTRFAGSVLLDGRSWVGAASGPDSLKLEPSLFALHPSQVAEGDTPGVQISDSGLYRNESALGRAAQTVYEYGTSGWSDRGNLATTVLGIGGVIGRSPGATVDLLSGAVDVEDRTKFHDKIVSSSIAKLGQEIILAERARKTGDADSDHDTSAILPLFDICLNEMERSYFIEVLTRYMMVVYSSPDDAIDTISEARRIIESYMA